MEENNTDKLIQDMIYELRMLTGITFLNFIILTIITLFGVGMIFFTSK